MCPFKIRFSIRMRCWTNSAYVVTVSCEGASVDSMALDPMAGLREWKQKVARLQERWRGARRENEQLRQENEQLRRREQQLEVPVDKRRQLRQAWDDVAALAKRYQGAELADCASGEVHGMAADAIREELGQQFPSIDALNKEYSFWKNVDKVVGDTILRQGQAKPLGQKLAQAAGTAEGYAKGGVGGAVLGREAMAALEKIITSHAWGTVSAVMKDKLATAMASRDTNAVIDIVTRLGAAGATQCNHPEHKLPQWRKDNHSCQGVNMPYNSHERAVRAATIDKRAEKQQTPKPRKFPAPIKKKG